MNYNWLWITYLLQKIRGRITLQHLLYLKETLYRYGFADRYWKWKTKCYVLNNVHIIYSHIHTARCEPCLTIVIIICTLYRTCIHTYGQRPTLHRFVRPPEQRRRTLQLSVATASGRNTLPWPAERTIRRSPIRYTSLHH